MSLNYIQGIVQKEVTSGDDDLTDSSEENISQSKACFHHYFSQLFIGLPAFDRNNTHQVSQ